MHKISAILREHTDEIATLETMDNGKTFPESCEDTVNVADFFDYYAGWTDKFYGDVNPVMGDFFSYTVREPMGVCGQIIPWNYPMDMHPGCAADDLRPGDVGICIIIQKGS